MTMQKLKFLRVQFDTEIAACELPAFRGAVAGKAGLENILFHNHDKEKGGYRYGYPLIQYKRIGRQPAILCLGEGVEEIHHFFGNRNWDIHLSGRAVEMRIAKLELNQFTMQVWDRPFDYEIRNWVALDQDSYRIYQRTQGLTDQLRLLESKLTGNILSLAKGIGWTVDRPIQVSITQMGEVRPVAVKGVKVLGFNLLFRTNVFLPDFIGLGKNVSLGFGTVTRAR